MCELVSILIPAYNAETWIKDTISSAMSQTWPKKEIIIVDDGSTDNTLQVAKSFESNTVKVISQENKGASAARNKALAFAQGDYIQWLDADDLLGPDKISQQLSNSDGYNARVLLSSAFGTFYYRCRKAKYTPTSLWRDLSPVEWFLIRFIDNVWMANSSWLVSRRLTEMAGPWDERLSFDDDGEYFCRVVAASERVKFCRAAECYYRIGSLGSLSTTKSDRASESLFMAIDKCIHYLRSLEDSERTRTACVKYLQNRLSHFCPDKRVLLEKAKDLARDLGGNLLLPKENWKFYLIKKILGFKMATNIKNIAWTAKLFACRDWDRLLYILKL